MQSRWLPLRRPQAGLGETRFKHSLLRNILIVLLLISLIPLLFIGTLNIVRSREMLGRQTSRQLESIVKHEIEQLTQYVDMRNGIIERMVTDQIFHDNLYTLLHTPADGSDAQQAKSAIKTLFRTGIGVVPESFFDQMFIVRPDGSVIMASDDNWVAGNFGGGKIQHQVIRNLIGTDRSIFVYNPVSGYTNKMILLISRSLVDDQGAKVATLITTSSTDLTYLTLSDSSSFLPDTNAYYFTPEAGLIGVTNNGNLIRMPENTGLSAYLTPLVGQQSVQLQFTAQSYNHVPVIAFAEWLSKYDIGVVLAVSEQSVYQLSNFADPLNIILLLVSLVISGTLVYFVGINLVTPLVKLSHAADTFSSGKWDERVEIKRSDEIGLLAHSFNHMADELSELYHSLETAVERRTALLRVASEVAQMATSTTKLSDTMGRTVELIADRFGFYHVAIYLFDENGENLILREAGGTASQQIKKRGDRVEAGTNTLIGWVAWYNQAKIISNIQEDPLFRVDELLPDTRSETAVPITIGTEVLGVLDIQSTLINAFDDQIVAVFQTLANQISGTLQATRLLESTQLSYQETSLLYRAARQIIQARSQAEINQSLIEAFIQLPFVGSILSVEGQNFKIQAVTDSKAGRVDTSLQTLNIPTAQMAGLLKENRAVLVEDIAQPSGYENLLSFLVRRECKTAALISVLENGRLSKVLVFGYREPDQVTHASLQPYAILAEIIGASLEKHRLLEAFQKRLAELQILASFSQAISAETDITNLYHVLHEQVIQTLGPDLEFAVAIYNQAENLIEFPYFYEEKQVIRVSPSNLGEGLTSIVIQNRRPLLLYTEQEISALSPIISGKPPRSWMGVPLIFAGEVVGAIIIQDLVNENFFSQDDINLFMTLAPQMATHIRNAQLYSETQRALRAYDEERFMFNTLLDAIPEGISIKNPHGQYIRASESIARLYNISAEEIIGKTDFDLADRETAETTFREEQMVMNLGKPEIGQIRSSVSPSGAETWTQISRLPIRTAAGDPYGLLLIQSDVTELKQAEALAQQRAEQILTAAEIARDATGTLDVTTLLQKSVTLIRERFGFYHASVFLIDSTGENAVLRESTGLAGEKMLQEGHKLVVGSKSIVGQVTATHEAVIENDVNAETSTHMFNPLLPDTRSELAIPLKVGERILGALDVQSTQVDAFNAEDIGILQILADQMAVAVVNGELFAKTQELLGKHRLLRQISIAASSSTNLEDAIVNVVSGLRTAMVGDRIAVLMLNDEGQLQIQASTGYEGTRHLETRLARDKGICGQAALEKRPIRVDDVQNEPQYVSMDPMVRSELAIPILFSDELIGVLNLESTQAFAFDENDQEILGALGNNLGGVIANIRLVNQVRQQVIRERQLFEVTSKIRYSVDMETILETSAKEIARALGARRASIRITAGGPARAENRIDDHQETNPSGSSSQGPNDGRSDGRSKSRSNGHSGGQ